MKHLVIPNWRAVLAKAYSVKFAIAAVLLTGIDTGITVLLQLGYAKLPYWLMLWLPLIAMLAAAGALGSRFIAQKELHNGE